MIDVDIRAGKLERLSVKLNIDLSAYCKAAFIKYQAKTKLLQEYKTKLQQEQNPIGNSEKQQAEYVAARISPEIKANFDQAREEVLPEFIGFNGGLHWERIQQSLIAQCDKTNPNEKLLALSLTSSLGNENSVSLSAPSLDESCIEMLKILDVSFIELLKNSADAVIKRYLADSSSNSMLELSIAVKLNSSQNQIKITFTDNGGGFPADYIALFNDCVSSGVLMKKRCSEKLLNSDREFYFGGEGEGLATLVNKLNEAKLKGTASKSVPPIEIHNNLVQGGAEIELTSSFLHFQKEQTFFNDRFFKQAPSPSDSNFSPELNLGQSRLALRRKKNLENTESLPQRSINRGM